MAQERTENKMIKILKKGIKANGTYHPCWYSNAELINYPKGTITVYAKTYESLPADLKPENDSDMMTDYFEKDRARITPDHPLYNEFLRQIESRKAA